VDGLASESGGVCGVVVSVSVGERAVWGGQPSPACSQNYFSFSGSRLAQLTIHP
jgi:hypothetical protein